MFKQLGSYLTFKTVVKTTTDSFYGTGTTVETTVNCYGSVQPARAYDIHSNIYTRPNDVGKEDFGIINIYISATDGDKIDIEDYYEDSVGRYKVVSKEYWDETYILTCHLES